MHKAHNLEWPDTGRPLPQNVKTEIHHVHPNWQDLVWWNEKRTAWTYVSTLPKTASDTHGK